jgi:AmmeMemoRadiSam system protein B
MQHKTVRHSVVAGTWYPGSESGLAQAVDGYLDRVNQPPVEGELLALISPHAGYPYSGQTAAYAYHQLQGRSVDTVVLMGPSHRAWVGDYAVSAEEAYETPLGLVSLDQAFIADLSGRVSLQRIRRDAEHSLEIQLPFLQRVLGEFKLVPIMMSADDPAVARRLAVALVEIVRLGSEGDGRILFVASSDLHHVENYDEVVRRDRAVVEALGAYDLDSLTAVLMGPRSTVCGRIPILVALHAARALGADAAQVLYHTNSGDVSGERRAGQYTVGYMAAAIYRTRSAGHDA